MRIHSKEKHDKKKSRQKDGICCKNEILTNTLYYTTENLKLQTMGTKQREREGDDSPHDDVLYKFYKDQS